MLQVSVNLYTNSYQIIVLTVNARFLLMWLYYMLRMQKYQFLVKLSKFLGMLLCIQSQENIQAQITQGKIKFNLLN